jgi:ABC-2 type transport system ATP-binding protein
VRVRGLSRRFGQHLALAPLDLDLGPGGVTGLLGPNGSGKSTFLRCLLGLVRASSGEAWVDGVRLEGDGTAIRRRVTFAPGELALYGGLRGAEQLDWLCAGRSAEETRRAHALADDLGLPLRARVRSYSHGMKRQLLFAAAMAPRVGVRILDEITEGLDPSKRGAVLELLREDAARGTTILLSSHHLGEVRRACDAMVFLRGGEKLSEESAAEVQGLARRTLQLRYAGGADGEALRRALPPGSLERLEVEGERATLLLAEEDPRPVLAALAAAPELPAPGRIEYGELSLEDLYRDLYGEDAC